MTEQLNHQRTAAARKALAVSGKSPKALGNMHRIAVVNWVYRWGYTSSSIIQQLVRRTSGGYAERLVTQGYLVSTPTESGTPKNLYTLGELGLQLAERNTTRLHPYREIDPCRIAQQLVQHNLHAQRATLRMRLGGKLADYLTERQLPAELLNAPKRPDVVWIDEGGNRLAVEIELSAKWERRLDEFVHGICESLRIQEDTGQVLFAVFFIFSTSPAILQRYQAAFKAGAPVNRWQKDQRNHWQIVDVDQVPDWAARKVHFLPLV